MNSKGFIYLIADYTNEAYKIGVSKNKVTERMKQLQTGNSTELVLLETYHTEYPYRMESILHNRFKHKNIYNEWFALDMDDIVNFQQTCQDVDKTIHLLKDNIFFSKNLR